MTISRLLPILMTLLASLTLALPAAAASKPSTSDGPDAATLRRWVGEIKASPKGPFHKIRWFCADGTDHPAKPYPCAERGGGIQHGSWTDNVKRMRASGYSVANLLAEVEPSDFVGSQPDLDVLSQILLERFLMGADNGWLFRGAFGYRGAFQIEDEEAGARALVDAMLADPEWRTPARFALIRETIRLMPLQSDVMTASKVRQLAIDIANADSGFAKLRAKIHGAPDAGDAAAVRSYAAERGKPAAAALYEEIATSIDALYATSGAVTELRDLAGRTPTPAIADALTKGASRLEAQKTPAGRLAAASALMADLRGRFQNESAPAGGLELLQASLALERQAYTSGNTLLAGLSSTDRRERLRWLNIVADGLYGTGFLSKRQYASLRTSINEVARKPSVTVDTYRDALRYLSRVPEWSARWLSFNFGVGVERFAVFEPLAHLYSQDRLRGSPLLFYGAVLDSLVLDANQLAGVRGEFFGANIGAGLRGLNPGLARGVIHTPANLEAIESFDRSGIYLLPETVSDLPPVAGILTQGEGSSLSHVQLLARNLGIPNVVVTSALLPKVSAHSGQRAVMAVSPGGVVQIGADGPAWDPVFGSAEKTGGSVVIRPDLEKLDLERAELIPLEGLRATDSGRTSGPKGANLGELKFYFGDAVPNGFVIPFGIFRKLLDQPLEPGGPSVFEWMKKSYVEIDAIKDPAAREKRVKTFLARVRTWIANSNPGDDFRRDLKSMLAEKFGPDGTYGVFVRSDTNVEDLAGFTGAGLNLTVFNVVGFDNIWKAIHDVWASPFTERAYGWRQGNMADPAYVFPAVVVQVGFPSEKSGVMVTSDIDEGEPDWISIAVSEGVGGAVDGQATESLRVNRKTGEVQFQAQATSPKSTVLLPTGGIGKRPASGTSAVLERAEIDQLIAFADDVSRFPSLRDGEKVLPADIEFGFKDGQLAMLQIRPFVESASAQRNLYLQELDAGLSERGRATVNLDAVP